MKTKQNKLKKCIKCNSAKKDDNKGSLKCKKCDAKKERIIKIQPVGQGLFLPYPFFIDKNAMVGRQDFWRGNPLKLIGFNKRPIAKSDEDTIDFSIFWKSPKKAIDMYPIFEKSDGNWYTDRTQIGEIRLIK